MGRGGLVVRWLVALAVAAAFTAAAGDARASGTVSGTIAADTEWSGFVHVTGSVTVAGGTTLTIDPGATVAVDPNASIVVDGALRANGQAGSPVVVEEGQAGLNWGQILGRAGSQVQLEQVILDGAGTTGPGSGGSVRPLECKGCRLTVDDSSVRNQASNGLVSVLVSGSASALFQRDSLPEGVHLASGSLLGFGLALADGTLVLDSGTATVGSAIVGHGVVLGSGGGGSFGLANLDVLGTALTPSGTYAVTLEAGDATVLDSIIAGRVFAYASSPFAPLALEDVDFPGVTPTTVVAHEGLVDLTAAQLGALTVSPQFAGVSDFHLSPSSPLLGAGSPGFAGFPNPPAFCLLSPCSIGALGTSGPLASLSGDPDTTTVAASPAATASSGTPVTLTATVTPAGANVPTGTVLFTDGFPNGTSCTGSCTVLGTGTLGPDGTASITTSSLAVGDHSLYAVYEGATDPNSGQQELPSPSFPRLDYVITAVAGAPAVSLEPAAVDFGIVDVGSNASTVVTLTNSGSAALHLGSPAFDAGSGPFAVSAAAPAGSCNAVTELAAGDSCTITLEFTPATGGPASGSLTITDDAPDSPQTVSLEGGGHVLDTTPPTVTPEIEGTLGDNAWYTSDVTVTWQVTDPESAISSSTGCGASTITADTDPTGTTVTCTATSEGGTTTSSATVRRDATPPANVATTLARGPDHGGWYTHSVDWVTAGTDATSGIASCTHGTYSGPDDASALLQGSCIDAAGNTTAAAPVGLQYDVTPPPLPTLTAPADGAHYLLGQAVSTAYACEPDATSGLAACNAPLANGAALDTTTAGANTFSVTATDAAGNTSTTVAHYSIGYAPAGTPCLGDPGHTVLPPVNQDGSSVFKAGSTVPIKFRVCDALGRSIGTPGVVTSFKLVQKTVGNNSQSLNQTPSSTTPDATFRWDPTAQQWIFNLSTKTLAAGANYAYAIALADGTNISFRFSLR